MISHVARLPQVYTKIVSKPNESMLSHTVSRRAVGKKRAALVEICHAIERSYGASLSLVAGRSWGRDRQFNWLGKEPSSTYRCAAPEQSKAPLDTWSGESPMAALRYAISQQRFPANAGTAVAYFVGGVQIIPASRCRVPCSCQDSINDQRSMINDGAVLHCEPRLPPPSPSLHGFGGAASIVSFDQASTRGTPLFFQRLGRGDMPPPKRLLGIYPFSVGTRVLGDAGNCG
jgi:hypothetical protein